MAQPAENPPETAAPKKTRPKPPEGRRFQPGVSANPGGRPKGLAKAVREVVGDEAAFISLMAVIAWDPQEKTVDRIAAWKCLAERGWGKPPEYAPIEDVDPLEMSEQQATEIARSFDGRVDELARKREQAKKPRSR